MPLTLAAGHQDPKALKRVIKDLRTHAALDVTGLRPSYIKFLFIFAVHDDIRMQSVVTHIQHGIAHTILVIKCIAHIQAGNS